MGRPFENFVDHLTTPSRNFVEVPLASGALLTTLHPLLENVLQAVDHFEISCLGFFLKSPEIAWGEI
jgi:hypothetical protein